MRTRAGLSIPFAAAASIAMACGQPDSGGSSQGPTTGSTEASSGAHASGSSASTQAGGPSGASSSQSSRFIAGSSSGSSGLNSGSNASEAGTSGGPPASDASTGGGPPGSDAGSTPDGAAQECSSPPGWTLTWWDGFDGPDGSAADPTKWAHDVGGGGWGNQELEYYTDGTQNAVQQGGNLVITATTAGASSFTCSFPSNGPCQYTSARLKTQGLFSQQYGLIEARIQIPEGQGLWPAFWMLGADIETNAWPTCGEIDIMENIGSEPSINHGSLHMPAAGTTSDDQLTGSYTLPGGAKLGDAFHTYAVQWSASSIAFYVDGNLYETQTPTTATGRSWEFDQPFFLLLNVAVGGTFPGSPNATTSFPQTMKVDWVCLYEPADGG